MDRSNLTRTLRCYLLITVASVVYAIGFNCFYDPNGIGFGGITALGQILNHFFPAVPIGMVVLVANVPLFLLGWKLLGGHLLVSSLYAMAATSVLVDLLASIHTFPPMDPMLAAVFGGVSVGLALGVIFTQGATTGGTDLMARLLKIPFAWLPMGKLLLAVDVVMIAAVAVAFRSVDSALYGLISLYISSVVMDGVLYGLDTSKVAYIVTDHPRPMAQAIDRQLERGVTFLHGEGSFSGQDKLVLMCAFKQRQIVTLKQIVQQLDPNAFLIVCNAHEVLGLGFRRYQQNDI